MSTRTDAELLDAAREGERPALEALLERHEGQMLRFTRAACGDRAAAEEAFQEAMLAAARGLPSFEGRASLSTWLYTIARRACAAERRRAARQPALDPLGELAERADPAPGPEDRVQAAEIGALVGRALETLAPEHREVLLLRDVEGLSAPEAAGVLGIGVPALKSRLHRARKALREVVEPLLGPPPPPSPSCPDVAELLSRKLEGELSPGACKDMEAHLAGCPACRGSCEELREALAACRDLPVEPVPEPVRARVHASLGALLGGEP